MEQPPQPQAAAGSSWLNKFKSTVAVATTFSGGSSAPVISPVETDSKADSQQAAESTQAEPPTASSALAWGKLRGIMKKVTEIGADVIRLDPPEHALTPESAQPETVVTVSATFPAPATADEAESDSNISVEESRGLLGGRLKLPGISGAGIKGFVAKGVARVQAAVPGNLLGTPADAPPPEPEETFWGLSRYAVGGLAQSAFAIRLFESVTRQSVGLRLQHECNVFPKSVYNDCVRFTGRSAFRRSLCCLLVALRC